MRKLYLTRHGQTLFNAKKMMQGWCDSPLTLEGVESTIKTKQFIEENNLTFDQIYTSPLTRCLTTTQMITNQDFIMNQGLREWNFGDLEGDYSPDVFKHIKWSQVVFGKHPDFFKDHNGESYQEFVDRIQSTINEIINQNHDSTLIVTHGAVIRVLFNQLYDEKILNGGYFHNNCIVEYNITDDNQLEFVALYNPAYE